MTDYRERKIAGIANDIPDVEVDADDGATVLVIGWGSTSSAIHAAVRMVRKGGGKVARVHLRHLNPFPRNLGEVLRSYEKVLIPELNRGQLWRMLRAEYLVDGISLSKVQGAAVQGRRDPRQDPGVARVMTDTTTRQDWQSDQEVRWCPGCGDYTILATVQNFMADLGVDQGERRLRVRHRLLQPLPVLHEHLRDALASTGGLRPSPAASPSPTPS